MSWRLSVLGWVAMFCSISGTYAQGQNMCVDEYLGSAFYIEAHWSKHAKKLERKLPFGVLVKDPDKQLYKFNADEGFKADFFEGFWRSYETVAASLGGDDPFKDPRKVTQWLESTLSVKNETQFSNPCKDVEDFDFDQLLKETLVNYALCRYANWTSDFYKIMKEKSAAYLLGKAVIDKGEHFTKFVEASKNVMITWPRELEGIMKVRCAQIKKQRSHDHVD